MMPWPQALRVVMLGKSFSTWTLLVYLKSKLYMSMRSCYSFSVQLLEYIAVRTEVVSK